MNPKFRSFDKDSQKHEYYNKKSIGNNLNTIKELKENDSSLYRNSSSSIQVPINASFSRSNTNEQDPAMFMFNKAKNKEIHDIEWSINGLKRLKVEIGKGNSLKMTPPSIEESENEHENNEQIKQQIVEKGGIYVKKVCFAENCYTPDLKKSLRNCACKNESKQKSHQKKDLDQDKMSTNPEFISTYKSPSNNKIQPISKLNHTQPSNTCHINKIMPIEPTDANTSKETTKTRNPEIFQKFRYNLDKGNFDLSKYDRKKFFEGNNLRYSEFKTQLEKFEQDVPFLNVVKMNDSYQKLEKKIVYAFSIISLALTYILFIIYVRLLEKTALNYIQNFALAFIICLVSTYIVSYISEKCLKNNFENNCDKRQERMSRYIAQLNPELNSSKNVELEIDDTAQFLILYKVESKKMKKMQYIGKNSDAYRHSFVQANCEQGSPTQSIPAFVFSDKLAAIVTDSPQFDLKCDIPKTSLDNLPHYKHNNSMANNTRHYEPKNDIYRRNTQSNTNVASNDIQRRNQRRNTISNTGVAINDIQRRNSISNTGVASNDRQKRKTISNIGVVSNDNSERPGDRQKLNRGRISNGGLRFGDNNDEPMTKNPDKILLVKKSTFQKSNKNRNSTRRVNLDEQTCIDFDNTTYHRSDTNSNLINSDICMTNNSTKINETRIDNVYDKRRVNDEENVEGNIDDILYFDEVIGQYLQNTDQESKEDQEEEKAYNKDCEYREADIGIKNVLKKKTKLGKILKM